MSVETFFTRTYGCVHICQLYKMRQKYCAVSFSSSFVYKGAQILLEDNYSGGIISVSSHMHASSSSIYFF